MHVNAKYEILQILRYHVYKHHTHMHIHIQCHHDYIGFSFNQTKNPAEGGTKTLHQGVVSSPSFNHRPTPLEKKINLKVTNLPSTFLEALACSFDLFHTHPQVCFQGTKNMNVDWSGKYSPSVMEGKVKCKPHGIYREKQIFIPLLTFLYHFFLCQILPLKKKRKRRDQTGREGTARDGTRRDGTGRDDTRRDKKRKEKKRKKEKSIT